MATNGSSTASSTKRTNSFNDFVDVARGLVAHGYAQPGRIAAQGGSAGGELMGAAVNQAPELFGAVVADVPFVDVLNTMLDDTLPLTPGEWTEWGNPINDKAAFDLIRSYSPYDNVTRQAYPPMLITGGLTDPRVTYWEPAKWAARLARPQTDDNLLLLKINMGAGHGGKSGRWNAPARSRGGLRLRAHAGGRRRRCMLHSMLARSPPRAVGNRLPTVALTAAASSGPPTTNSLRQAPVWVFPIIGPAAANASRCGRISWFGR